MNTIPDFSYLRRRAEESKLWIAAGCQIGDEYDTYPADLFRAAANEDAVIALLDTIESLQAELSILDATTAPIDEHINALLEVESLKEEVARISANPVSDTSVLQAAPWPPGN